MKINTGARIEEYLYGPPMAQHYNVHFDDLVNQQVSDHLWYGVGEGLAGRLCDQLNDRTRGRA